MPKWLSVVFLKCAEFSLIRSQQLGLILILLSGARSEMCVTPHILLGGSRDSKHWQDCFVLEICWEKHQKSIIIYRGHIMNFNLSGYIYYWSSRFTGWYVFMLTTTATISFCVRTLWDRTEGALVLSAVLCDARQDLHTFSCSCPTSEHHLTPGGRPAHQSAPWMCATLHRRGVCVCVCAPSTSWRFHEAWRRKCDEG